VRHRSFVPDSMWRISSSWIYVELVSLAVVLAEETSSGKDAGRASNSDLIDCGGGDCKAMRRRKVVWASRAHSEIARPLGALDCAICVDWSGGIYPALRLTADAARAHFILQRRSVVRKEECPIHCLCESSGVPFFRSMVTRECRKACNPAFGMPRRFNSGCSIRFRKLLPEIGRPFRASNTWPALLSWTCCLKISARPGSMSIFLIAFLAWGDSSCPFQTPRRTYITQLSRSRSVTCRPDASPIRIPASARNANRTRHWPSAPSMIFLNCSSVKIALLWIFRLPQAQLPGHPKLFFREPALLPTILRIGGGRWGSRSQPRVIFIDRYTISVIETCAG
jgi:hypothetical protein